MVNRSSHTAKTSHKLAGALAALSTAVAAHGQTVLYVDDDAPLGGNGRSWSEAFQDLHDALWLASHVRDDVEIRIAQGIYTPDRGTGIREASFEIDDSMVGSGMTFGIGLSLKGAFAGIKALDPNERDTHRFKSVLSGDLNGDDKPGFVNYEDNSHHIVQVFDVSDSGVAFDGLVFRGGNATGPNLPWARGGAIRVVSSNIVILRDCVLRDNLAEYGGAISHFSSVCIVSRCFFGNNRAEYYGGAIHVNNLATALIANCVFSGNSSGLRGGAIDNNHRLEAAECTFYGNSTGSNGAAIFGRYGTTTVANSILFSNTPSSIDGATVSYSDVENGYAGIGNIDSDPLFTDPLGADGILGTPDDNFLPRFGSPVIDAGSNDALRHLIGAFDYSGQPRIVDDRFTPDTGVGTGPIVDMGAYEFQTPACYADLDQTTGVGVLDLLDFLRFQHLYFLNDPLACQVDRSTGPNHCDIFDFLAFQTEFVSGCP